MELEFSQRYLRLNSRGGSAVLSVRLPHLCGGNSAMEECYLRAAEAIEEFARNGWQTYLAEEFAKTARQSRLHRIEPQLQFVCQGELVEDRYVSLTLTLTKQSLTENVQMRTYRVWDGQEGILCPIELFLPGSKARSYHRWEFQLREREVLAMPRKRRKRDTQGLVFAGNRKKFSLPIDNKGRV